MLVHFGADLLVPEWSGSVVCIGTFDGVHLGHQAVIQAAIDQARVNEVPAALVTFDRHPAATLAPEKTPPILIATEQKLDIFRDLGVGIALVLPFDRELSQTPAEEFLGKILIEKLRARSIVVGHDFAFGKNRTGTSEWLAARIPTTVIPPVEVEGHRVSSSEIRGLVLSGQFERVERFLGRAWSMDAVVVSGQKIGRTIGFPTVNLARSMALATPPDGVYSGNCQTRVGVYRAAIGIGNRPTVGGTHRTIEAYLIDYPGDSLYGMPVRLSFERKLRDEINFSSLETLKEQMALDVAEARQKR